MVPMGGFGAGDDWWRPARLAETAWRDCRLGCISRAWGQRRCRFSGVEILDAEPEAQLLCISLEA